MEIDPELLACFLDEADDTLSDWERACLELESDENSKESSTALFRSAHNLKGASRAVGLDGFGEYVHHIEDVIQLLMRGEIPLSPELITLFLDAQVVLQNWVEGLRDDSDFTADAGNTLERVEAFVHGASAPSEVEKLADNVKKDPEPEVSNEVAEDDLEALFAAAQAEYNQQATEEVAEKEEPKQKAEDSEAPKPQVKKAKKRKNDETIRISADKLDSLIQLIGELTIHQAIITEERKVGHLDSKACQSALSLSNKITRDLHGKALSLRMQPVQSLFQRLERVARDVGRTQSKSIDVNVAGVDVELDKTVLERITDPLVHIIRNAVDHGIEPNEERKENGKNEKGAVSLTALQDAGGVCIEVKDNGKGLDKERIIAKALERELIRDASDLTEAEIYNLVFLPGFSTAEQVTDISGRGVGMDVVMKAVQSLNGTIHVTSELGKGSTFSVSLPTTLSIIDALVVNISNIRYAVPMQELTEIIDLSNYPVETSGKHGRMISLRGKVVPLKSLAQYLPVDKRMFKGDESTSDTSTPALIVKEGAGTFAFEIDEIVSQQQVVVRQLSKQLSKFKCFEGSTILGDGQPGMILNLPEIVRSQQKLKNVLGA